MIQEAPVTLSLSKGVRKGLPAPVHSALNAISLKILAISLDNIQAAFK
jgi:hypothetical protein